MKDELAALLPRLEGGEASRELDAALWKVFVPEGSWPNFPNEPQFTQSLDAALALAERVLPGWAWCMFSPDPSFDIKVAEVSLSPPGSFDGGIKATGKSPALALCAAIVKAKIGEVG